MVPALHGFALAEVDPAHAVPAAIGAARAALRLAWCDTALRAARCARRHLGGIPLGELADAKGQHAHLRRELRIGRARLAQAPGPGNLAPLVSVLTSAGRLRAARALLGPGAEHPLLRLADAVLALREGQGSAALRALALDPALPEAIRATLADTLLSAGEAEAARTLADTLPPAAGLPIRVRAGLFDAPPQARLRDAEAWRLVATEVSQATEAARHGLTAALDAGLLRLDQVPRLPATPRRATLFAYWDGHRPARRCHGRLRQLVAAQSGRGAAPFRPRNRPRLPGRTPGRARAGRLRCLPQRLLPVQPAPRRGAVGRRWALRRCR